jgi:hypothetical protein
MPWTAWESREECPWPSRGEAVLKAFAIFAAERERTVLSILESLGEASK